MTELAYFGDFFFFLIETLDFWQEFTSLSLSFLTPSDLLNKYGILKFLGSLEEMGGKSFPVHNDALHFGLAAVGKVRWLQRVPT